jgi:hypothetical protein
LASVDGESVRLRPIYCHSVVLCSVAPNFKKFLLDPDSEKEEDYKYVLLPNMVNYYDVGTRGVGFNKLLANLFPEFLR